MGKRVRFSLACAAGTLFACLLSVPVASQWLEYKTPGIPRTPDGKPDLAAPAPRVPDGKPDLSGIWRGGILYALNVTVGLKPEDFQPWAAELYQERVRSLRKDSPSGHCLPSGIPFYDTATPLKIVQTPTLIVILYEASSGSSPHREIYMDGRQLPADPNPTWFGYSVGRWEGDALVVETSGFNDKSWLDDGGHPHSDALHLTERFERRDFGHMDFQMTIEDPKAYRKPWTIKFRKDLMADTQLLENVCENERDVLHLVGK